jgi:hypothetical protein
MVKYFGKQWRKDDNESRTRDYGPILIEEERIFYNNNHSSTSRLDGPDFWSPAPGWEFSSTEKYDGWFPFAVPAHEYYHNLYLILRAKYERNHSCNQEMGGCRR